MGSSLSQVNIPPAFEGRQNLAFVCFKGEGFYSLYLHDGVTTRITSLLKRHWAPGLLSYSDGSTFCFWKCAKHLFETKSKDKMISRRLARDVIALILSFGYVLDPSISLSRIHDNATLYFRPPPLEVVEEELNPTLPSPVRRATLGSAVPGDVPSMGIITFHQADRIRLTDVDPAGIAAARFAAEHGWPKGLKKEKSYMAGCHEFHFKGLPFLGSPLAGQTLLDLMLLKLGETGWHVFTTLPFYEESNSAPTIFLLRDFDQQREIHRLRKQKEKEQGLMAEDQDRKTAEAEERKEKKTQEGEKEEELVDVDLASNSPLESGLKEHSLVQLPRLHSMTLSIGNTNLMALRGATMDVRQAVTQSCMAAWIGGVKSWHEGPAMVWQLKGRPWISNHKGLDVANLFCRVFQTFLAVGLRPAHHPLLRQRVRPSLDYVYMEDDEREAEAVDSKTEERIEVMAVYPRTNQKLSLINASSEAEEAVTDVVTDFWTKGVSKVKRGAKHSNLSNVFSMDLKGKPFRSSTEKDQQVAAHCLLAMVILRLESLGYSLLTNVTPSVINHENDAPFAMLFFERRRKEESASQEKYQGGIVGGLDSSPVMW